MEAVKVIASDCELHELWDLFEEGKLPQPLFTKKEENLNILFFEKTNNIINILESTLGRKAQPVSKSSKC